MKERERLGGYKRFQFQREKTGKRMELFFSLRERITLYGCRRDKGENYRIEAVLVLERERGHLNCLGEGEREGARVEASLVLERERG